MKNSASWASRPACLALSTLPSSPELPLPSEMVQRSFCSLFLHLLETFPDPTCPGVYFYTEKMCDVLSCSGRWCVAPSGREHLIRGSLYQKALLRKNTRQCRERFVLSGTHGSPAFCCLESCESPTLSAAGWVFFLAVEIFHLNKWVPNRVASPLQERGVVGPIWSELPATVFVFEKNLTFSRGLPQPGSLEIKRRR